jgi:hypothetical protein
MCIHYNKINQTVRINTVKNTVLISVNQFRIDDDNSLKITASKKGFYRSICKRLICSGSYHGGDALSNIVMQTVGAGSS